MEVIAKTNDLFNIHCADCGRLSIIKPFLITKAFSPQPPPCYLVILMEKNEVLTSPRGVVWAVEASAAARDTLRLLGFLLHTSMLSFYTDSVVARA